MQNKFVDLSGKPFHFIGIGGIGMSALAYILAKRNLPVSGSDLRTSHITERLSSLGIRIFNKQEASNIAFFNSINNTKSQNLSVRVTDKIPNFEFLPQVVCSTAISPNNPEYQAAKELGCAIFHRADLLAALIADYESIAVAGTHGKTTTSCAISYMLLKAGLDPTIVVGGEVDAWEGNARLGQSKFLVAEADESDGSLIEHSPKIGIITNIELDHPDRYKTLDEVVEIFRIFASQCETLVGCIDDPVIRDNFQPDLTYSLDGTLTADYVAKNITYTSEGSISQIWEKGEFLGNMELCLPGKHNISNALAVVAVGRKIGLEFSIIAEGISSFKGSKRRFEFKGYANGITFIDDYAHHPSELEATLAAARIKVKEEANKYQRVVAIFQPHRYSRTHTFLEEFATSFNNADVAIVTDIYSAGEDNLWNINGEQLARAIGNNHPQVIYEASVNSLLELLPKILKPGDLTLFLGAGNLNQIIPQIIDLTSID